MRDKISLTQALIDQLPAEHKIDLDQAVQTWWVNKRKSGGMRLTNLGYAILHDILGIESYQLEIVGEKDIGPWRAKLTKRVVLDLDRKLEWPYYLDFSAKKKSLRLVFFSSREAMLATLYGDLEKFLKNYIN